MSDGPEYDPNYDPDKEVWTWDAKYFDYKTRQWVNRVKKEPFVLFFGLPLVSGFPGAQLTL